MNEQELNQNFASFAEASDFNELNQIVNDLSYQFREAGYEGARFQQLRDDYYPFRRGCSRTEGCNTIPANLADCNKLNLQNPISLDLQDDKSWSSLPSLGPMRISTHEDVFIESTITEVSEKQTQVEFSSPVDSPTEADEAEDQSVSLGIRLNYKQKQHASILNQLYASRDSQPARDFMIDYEQCKAAHEGKITSTGGDTLAKKRCNQTKYVKNLMKCIVAAAAKVYNFDHAETYRELHVCSKVDSFRLIIFRQGREEFAHFLREIIEPGFLYLTFLSKTVSDSVVSILLLEALVVLQRMMAEPTRPVTSWKMDRLSTKGDYAPALKKLHEETASLSYLRNYCKKQYERLQSNFKKNKCSIANNITHFFCVVMERIQCCLLERLEQEMMLPSDKARLRAILLSNLEQLKMNESEATLEAVTKNPWIKRLIHQHFALNNGILIMILELNTSALVIHNLIDRYQWFLGHIKEQEI